MEKPFLEVFPGLHIGEELKELLKLVMVEKVSMPKDRSSLRIYIVSPRLIHKKNICSMEEGIAKQLFPGRSITVKILEKYRLSAQYTPEKLYQVYKDSILMEFKNFGMIEYNILRRAETAFEAEDTMVMTIEDNLIYRERSKEVGRILEKIFTERCGLPAEVRFSFTKAEKERRDDFDEEAALAALLASHVQDMGGGQEEMAGSRGQEEDHGDPGGGGAPAKDQKPGSRTFTKKTFGEKKTAGGKGNPVSGAGNGGFQGGQNGSGSGFKRDGGRGGRMPYRKSENPDVLYGRDFEGETMEIHEIAGEIGEVVLRGKIIRVEKRELRSGSKMMIFDLTDFTDSITIKMFLREDQEADADEAIKQGKFIKLKGITTIDRFDGELTVGSITGIKKCEDFTTRRVDNAPVKRVELHCHTKMSDMDGVSEVKDIIKRAKQWGMPALAVTDHGCVQAFPDASHALDKGDAFKVLYGVEGYLVDDMKEIVENSKNQSLDGAFVVFDIETTGFSPVKNKIIEIGAVRVENGVITDRMDEFVDPEVPIPFEIERLTGINDAMVMGAETIGPVLGRFLEFSRGAVLVAHNASFDVGFISHNASVLGYEFHPTVMDTVALARVLLPNLNRYKLDTVAKALNVSLENHHRAVDDAEATAGIFLKFVEMLKKQHGMETLDDLNVFNQAEDSAIMKMPTYHVIILAKNDLGRVNLYRLVSWSHVRFFSRRPRIPKSLLNQYREGLIIGSACEAGELYQAILRGGTDAELQRLVRFYDYLEIQPLGNDMFMLRDEKSTVKTVEDLKEINRKIVRLGEQCGKPVCATCDVHFLDPEDEIYRRILMAGMGFKDSDEQAPLYLSLIHI